MSLKSRLGLLADHDFRGLFISTSATQLGHRIAILALPLTAILGLSASEFEVGVLTALTTAAFLLVGLPAGAWVDRMRRRLVMITADFSRAIVLFTVPLAWWADVLTMWQLYAVALINGIFTVFFDVAYQSYLPHLVGRKNLVEANAKLESVRAITEVGGPGAAGQLVAWLTAPIALLAHCITMSTSALFVVTIRKREPKPEPQPNASLTREIKEGLSWVLVNPLLRAIVLCTATFNFSMTLFQTMLLIYLVQSLGLSAATIGLIFSIGAVGGVLGAFLARRIAAAVGQGPTLLLSVISAAPMAALMPLASNDWTLWVAASGGIVVSLGVVVYNVTQVSFRQSMTPDALLGRMNASVRFIVFGTMPLGAFISGILGANLGVVTTLWIGVAGLALATVPILASPLRTLKELPTAPDEKPATPVET